MNRFKSFVEEWIAKSKLEAERRNSAGLRAALMDVQKRYLAAYDALEAVALTPINDKTNGQTKSIVRKARAALAKMEGGK